MRSARFAEAPEAGVTAARRLLVALILASTAAFVVGVLLERLQTTRETVETPAQRAAEAGEASEAGERKPTSSSAAGESTGETASHREASGHVESSEKLLGVNPESTVLLAVAVVVSLLLAAAVWWRGGSAFVLGIVVVAMVAFGALDIREVVHQVNESRTGLAVLAAVVAALHGAAGLLAGRDAVMARGVPPSIAA
jgi:hypothetical protein